MTRSLSVEGHTPDWAVLGPELLDALRALMPLMSVIDLWDDLPYPDVQKRRIADAQAALRKALPQSETGGE